MPLKDLWLVGVHPAYGYPADMQVHENHLKGWIYMYISLKCCNEETGKCASNPMSRQGEEVHDLQEVVNGIVSKRLRCCE